MPVRTPIEDISGNASDYQKEGINDALTVYCQETGFCYGISDRMRLVEAAETDHPEVGGQKILRAVFELKVEPDMVDAMDALHSGCVAYLADLCTSATYAMDDTWGFAHLSTSLNTAYHARARL
ncbi:hypothetical protein FRB98_003456 [Tulasnella sp. 332]|nr:hypothetical protein FRB98_003456 [Tulasnella sp. 332]